MPDFDQMFEKLQELFGKKTKRLQVAKLTGDCLMEWKVYQSTVMKRMNEIKVIEMKAKSIQAELMVQKAEIWNKIYTTYSIPSDADYSIERDGTVYKVVEESNGNEGSCDC